VSEQLRSQLHGSVQKEKPQETFDIRMRGGTEVSVPFLPKAVPPQVVHENARFIYSQSVYVIYARILYIRNENWGGAGGRGL